MPTTRQQGAFAEKVVCRYLEEQGYAIVAQNVYIGGGEIDIIASHGEYLAFVEVKSRTAAPYSAKYGRPALAVTAKKKAMMLVAAREYLRANPTHLRPRLDIAEVVIHRHEGEERFDIRHFPNAVIQTRRETNNE
ncbi:MAG: YraN family protein [Oscillospiraceae bacterium]|nr:YraN family protein [Oscillospiraceae bacterium]